MESLPENLRTGIESIDKQHLTLFITFDSILKCLNTPDANEEISNLISFLASYTKSHLETEEKIMQEKEYPGLEAHKNEHEMFRIKIRIIEKANFASPDNKDVLDTTLKETKKWIMNHVLKTDIKMTKFIKDNQ